MSHGRNMMHRIAIVAITVAATLMLAGIAAAAPVHASGCATPTGPNRVRCTALIFHRVLLRSVTAPQGYGPAQLRVAYGLGALAGTNPTTTQTNAIVDAYNDPNLASDLAAYRSYFGLSACPTASGCLRVVSQAGSTRLPVGSTAWGLETSLDAEMVSAICPRCHIAVVEASSATYADLGAAENEAVKLGAHVISNSWGGTDSPRDSSYDSQYFNHPGVAIVAATGDSGFAAGPIYPSTSPDVIAVGGTTLTPAAGTPRGYAEAAWSGGGSGCSSVESMPAWQAALPNAVAACGTHRAVADVSADANPATGVAVYDTYGYAGWYPGMIGGTSLAAPIVGAIYALAGNAAGAASAGAGDLYAHASYTLPNLFDVVSGSNGTCTARLACTAGAGWDGPTGLGSPDGIAGF
jgi:subtilase family serine protease